MINHIIAGISIALDEEFGDAYEIHMEEIKQDLKEPCFFISCLNPTMERFMGKRYFRRNQFCIQYFPSTDSMQAECHDVAERMLWKLEQILVSEEPIRGTKMKYEVVDEVLNFFVNYDMFIYRAEEIDLMDTIESNTSVKG